jgi:hypothetical protein
LPSHVIAKLQVIANKYNASDNYELRHDVVTPWQC